MRRPPKYFLKTHKRMYFKNMGEGLFCVLDENHQRYFFYSKFAERKLPERLVPYAVDLVNWYLFEAYHLGLLIVCFSNCTAFIDYPDEMKLLQLYLSHIKCPTFFEQEKVPALLLAQGKVIYNAVKLTQSGSIVI